MTQLSRIQQFLNDIVDIGFFMLNGPVSTPTGYYNAASTLQSHHQLEASLEHLRRHPHLKIDDIFSNDDMKEIWPTWTNDYTSLKQQHKLQEYELQLRL